MKPGGTTGLRLFQYRQWGPFLKRRYTQSGETRLDRRRIFIFPTPFGAMFAATLIVMLLGAINYGNSMAFMFTFLLGSLGLVSALHTYRNLAGLSIGAGRSYPAFAGQEASFTLWVDNDTDLARYALRFITREASTLTNAPPQNRSEVRLRIPTRHRGRLRLGTVTLETRYPLGLFRAWSYLDPGASTWVYPRPASGGGAPPSGGGLGGNRSAQVGGSEDFVGFRSYQAGDSLRHIHWKAVARGEAPVTKQFGDYRNEELWFDWDKVPARDTEARLSILCRWVIDAEQDGYHYGLRLPGQALGPARGEAHKHRCLRALAWVEGPR